MQLLSSLLLTATAITTAIAAPSPQVEPKACSYHYSPDLNEISQHIPNAGSPSTKTPFTVWNDIGLKDEVVSFRYIPDGSYGCSLQLDYQPGHNPIVDKQQGDPTRFDVWRLNDGGNFPYVPTWNNTAPRMSTYYGSWRFPENLDQAQVVNIADFNCDAVLTFRMSVADGNAKGGVSLPQDATSGLRIAYNC